MFYLDVNSTIAGVYTFSFVKSMRFNGPLDRGFVSVSFFYSQEAILTGRTNLVLRESNKLNSRDLIWRSVKLLWEKLSTQLPRQGKAKKTKQTMEWTQNFRVVLRDCWMQLNVNFDINDVCNEDNFILVMQRSRSQKSSIQIANGQLELLTSSGRVPLNLRVTQAAQQ